MEKAGAWKCLRCGICCTKLDVMVTPDEERRLEKYGEVFERGRVLVYLRKVKGRCIFLENGNCAIYPERPMACVKYPFYFKSKGDAESRFDGIHVYVDSSCPGVVLGNHSEAIVNILEDLMKNL